MTTMVDFYIELAAVPAPADHSKMAMTFPASLRRRLPSLPLVPIISVDIPVDPSAQYNNITHISGDASPAVWNTAYQTVAVACK